MADINVIIGGSSIALSLSQDVGVRGAAGPAGGVAFADSGTTFTTGTIVLANSNGVSFGMDTNGVVTATVQGAGGDFSASSNYQLTSDMSLYQQASGMSDYQQTSGMTNFAPAYHAHQSGIERNEATDNYPVITDGVGGDAGKVKVAAATVWFYDEQDMDSLTMHSIPESAFLTMTDDVSNYVCADRDTDAWVVITEVSSIDYLRYIPYFLVVKRAGSNNLHKQVIVLSAHGEAEYSHQKNFACARYQREEGALLGLSVADTTRAITLAGGGVWATNYRYNMMAVTTATRQFECVLNTGTWSYSSHTNPVLPNTQYNGPSGLVTMTDNYYAILYVWRGIENEDHLYTFLSDQEFASLELAQASKTLGTIPPLASGHAMFVGRIVFKKNGSTSADWVCEGAFDTVFSASSAVTDHGSLLGLGDNDHPQYLLSINASSVTASAMNTSERADYIQTANSSLFQHTSGTSAITANAFPAANSSNLVAASNSSLFQHTSGTSAITANAFPTANTTNLAGSSVSSRVIAINGTTGNFSINAASNLSGGSLSQNGSNITIGVATNFSTGWTNITSNCFNTSGSSNFVLTANSSLLQHTSATSAITANAFPSAQTTKFAGTGTGATNCNVTANSNGISVSVNAGGADGYNSAQFTNSTANTTQAILWAGNSNGSGNVTMGLTGSTVTMSAPSGAGGGATVNGSTGNVSFYAGSNLTLSTNGSSLTYGIVTNYSTNWTAQTTDRAGTGTTFNGANISGSMTHNTNGLALSLSVAAPGAAAENNWFTLGGNVAGNSSASGSTVQLIGGNNITLHGTNNSQISIIGGGGGVFTYSYFNPQDGYLQVAGQQGQSSLHVQPMQAPNVTFDRIAVPLIFSNATNSSGSQSLSIHLGIYTKNASTLSLLSSTSYSTAITASGTVGAYSSYGGMRLLTIASNGSLSEGQYWLGMLSLTTSGGANATISQVLCSQLSSNFSGVFGETSNATHQYTRGLGVFSAQTNVMRDSIAFSHIRGTAPIVLRQPMVYFVLGTV